MAKLFKNLAVAALAVLAMFMTLNVEKGIKPEEISTYSKVVAVRALENGVTVTREGESVQLEGEKNLKQGDTVLTAASQNAILVFDEYGEIRLAPETEIFFMSELEEGYVFKLNRGQVWVNNLYTSSYLNVLAGGALLMPRRTVFDLAYDGVSAKIRVFKNHVNVGLVDPGYVPVDIIQYKNDVLINSFLVAEGSQSTIFLNKVVNSADVLGKLLYSKLIKEFQYSLMDQLKLRADTWVNLNKGYDSDLLASVEGNKKASLDARGLKFASLDSLGYKMDGFLNGAADVLTFSIEKRMQRLINNIFDHLSDAEYLLAYGRSAEAQERLNLFKADITERMASADADFHAAVMNKLRYHYASLNYVLPNDNMFSAKEQLGDLLIAHLGTSEEELAEKLELIRDYLNYAFALVETDTARAKLALEQYSKKIDVFIGTSGARLGNMKYLLSEDNQIMDNLFRRYAQFYQDSFFALKSYLETEWLKLLPDGVDKFEEQQTIISNKIDFLRQVQVFFLAQKVTLNDARKIVLRLINEIQDLQPQTEVGISDLFALRLKDYGNFLLFLNSTDVASLRGVSPQQQYDNFLKAQSEQVSIEQAISEFFGEKPPEADESTKIELVLKQASDDFVQVGVKDAKFGPLESLSQKYIDVYSATFNKTVFSARYDWDNKQISQIKVGANVVSANPIRLSNLPLLLAPKVETEVPETPEEIEEEIPEVEEVSKAEKVAKILLIQKLKANDVSAVESNITIADQANQMYIVNGATLISEPNIQIAFIFNNREDQASSFTVRTTEGDFKLTGFVALKDISAKALATYESVTAPQAAE